MAGILILAILFAFIVALCVAGAIARRRAAGPGRFALVVLAAWIGFGGAMVLLLVLAFGLLFSR